MIGQESRAESVLAVRRACDELSSKLRAGIPFRAEEIFDTQPSLIFDSDAALELLYTEFVVREQLGQQPDIQEWLDRFPQWRHELQQLFEVHAIVEQGTKPRIGPSGTQIEDPAFYRPTASPPVFIGGYELLGEIGRGGMIRGFSQGGEGAWHISLHHPDRFAAAEIGAGTVSRTAEQRPDLAPFQLATLRIWENISEWALNIHNLPLAGHDGENDPGQLESSLRARRQLEKEGYPSVGDPDYLRSQGVPGLWMQSLETGHVDVEGSIAVGGRLFYLREFQ